MIRTTYHGRLSVMARETARVASQQLDLQRRAVTGLDIERPSDDPSQISHLHKVRAQVADQDVWQSNASYAASMLSEADQAIGNMTDLLSRARELAVQMSSETYSSEDRIAAASEVDGLVAEMVGQANSEFAGRYLFGGTAYDGEPYDASGVYQGDTGEPSVLVGAGLEISTGFDGSSLLQSTGDPIAALQDLATAMRSGNGDDVSDQLEAIDASIEQLIGARTTVGQHLSRADDAMELSETLQTQLVAEQSNIEDADPIDTYTQLYEAQTAYTAALQVIANSQMTPLFNMI